MKKSAAFALIAIVLAAGLGCEQQSYEETKMFNQSSKPGGHHGADHGHEGGAEKGDHAAPKHP